MKQSTKNFIGDVAKAVCAIGIVTLCRRFGVKTSFTIGDAVRGTDAQKEPASGPVFKVGAKWPEPKTTLDRRMLLLAQRGYRNTLACDRYDVAKKIFDMARSTGVSAHEKEFAVKLLAMYADRATLACDRNDLLDMICDLWA